MDKAVEITVKRQSGTFPVVVVVGEDGKFYKIKRTNCGVNRITLVAGILVGDRIAIGIRYYLEDLAHCDGQEMYFGTVGGRCEALLYHSTYSYDQEVEVSVKEVPDYNSSEDEIMAYEAADIYERSFLDHIMKAAKRSFGYTL